MRFTLFILLLVSILSCNNEFDLITEKTEVPVVYAVINPADTAQYFRLERIFADPESSALEIALNPDSLYYPNAVVKLRRESTGQEYVLDRVDGNEEGYVREDGAFAQAPNFLYKILTDDIPLEEEEEYTLVIENVFEDRNITSTVELIEAPTMRIGTGNPLVTFNYTSPINISWNPRGETPIFSFYFTFNIREISGTTSEVKQLRWEVEGDTEDTELQTEGIRFYNFLRGNLEVNPNIQRRFLSATAELVAGDEFIANYIRISKANTGITASGEVPVYSNLSEGVGIFGSSVSVIVENIGLSNITQDSLINGSITGPLNFN